MDACLAAGVEQQFCLDRQTTDQFGITEKHGELCHDRQRFTGLATSDLLFLEIYGGTARLSKAARDAGLQVLPIDKTSMRASQIFVAQYDVTNPEELAALLELIETEHKRVLAVHLAPACGTASRAREKKLSNLARKGFKIPVPLRSKEKPMGLDGLQGTDKLRTESANIVYSATATIVKLCQKLDLLCSIENPANSLFWFFPEIEALLDSGYSVSFHNCMHGGSRNKLTTWWSTKDVFSELGVLCDGKHDHAKWNPVPQGTNLSFPTAEEAAYPMLLCKRLVAVFVAYAMRMGASAPSTLSEQLPMDHGTSHRWVIDMLPKGKRMKPLVSEFQAYKQFAIEAATDPESSDIFQALPKGARIVQRQLQWGMFRVDEQAYFWFSGDKKVEIDLKSPILFSCAEGQQIHAELVTVGIPREPWDFLERAVSVGHPRSLAIHLNPAVVQMLQENFSDEPHLIVKTRAQFLRKWTKRCQELAGEETKLHQRLAPHLREVLDGKRLLLLKEMLLDLGYPDKDLVDTICDGFPLTGWMPKSQVFPAHMKRPTQSSDSARKLAKGVNKSIIKQVSEQSDPALATEVWRQSLEEVEKNWVWFDDEGGVEDKILAKRFGLQQSEKVRMIDDCSIGGFNSTCGTSEKMKVHAVDEMAAYICWCMTNLGPGAMSQVVGKTYDLKNAYKQFGIRPQDRDLLRLAVWDVENKKVRLMGTNALPFGAIGSVGAFLRISLAVWYVGVVGLRLCWTSFFDDFTLLTKKINSRSASVAAETLFSLLGLQFATEGKKAVEWSTRVKTLGVLVDLDPEGGDGSYVTIGHTENRVAELQTCLAGFLQTKRMSRKDAEKLRGRLQWFESFAHGRTAQQALRVISRIASTGRIKEDLTQFELSVISFLKDRVLRAPPTRIQSTNLKTWLVFSDGACEGDNNKVGTIGGVLISPDGIPCHYFSEVVPERWMRYFLSESEHPIFELELLPVWCAVCTWRHLLMHCQCVFYLDNEAAKGALIHAATSTGAGKTILQMFVQEEMDLQIKVWFSRVPTSSNISDDPSRLKTQEMDALGVAKSCVDWNNLWNSLGDVGSRQWGFDSGIQ